MFTYTAPASNGEITVRFGRRTLGHIRPVDGGFYYHPKGITRRNPPKSMIGETFPTVEGVKASLEEK